MMNKSNQCAVRSTQYAVRRNRTINCVLRTAYCALILLSASCSSTPSSEQPDTPTKGKITFSVDENVHDLAQQLVDVFETSYPDAFLITSYKSENAVVNDLYNDSSRLAIMTRRLSAEETTYFEGLKFGIEHIRI